MPRSKLRKSTRSRFCWKKPHGGRNQGSYGWRVTEILAFFHKMTNAHKRRNFLAKIKINGTWILEESGIKDGVVWAFQCILSKSGDLKPKINGLLFDELTVQDAAMLESLWGQSTRP